MTPTTCVEFTRSCTEEPCSEEDPRVVGLFAEYDGDHDGKIVLEEFLTFYLGCALDKEEVVRQNLHAHNYRYDLKLQPLDGQDENLLQVRKESLEMPRYILANDPLFFDNLFSLLELDSEISTNTWAVI